MSLSNQLTGVHAPIGSYLCNSIQKSESFCGNVLVPRLGKMLYMNDSIELSGEESWRYCPDRKAFYFHCKNKVLNHDENMAFDIMLCNRFIWRENNRELGVGDFSGGLGDLVFFHDDSFHGSVEAFKDWIRQLAKQGNPLQLTFSLEKPFLCSVDFSNHVKYYGFENTYIELSFMGQKKRIQIG